MKQLLVALLCGGGMMPMVAFAQGANPPSQADQTTTQTRASGAPTGLAPDEADTTGVTDNAPGDVVVTARRQSENLQNVPSTVQAISGESVQKLALTQFQDVASIVPGLSLGTGNLQSGLAPAPSIRGVSYDVAASPSPTVDLYVNEVPINAGVAFQTIYDLGGVEVLRGPQGTLRGRTAPSGAILLSTRKPDLHDVGGYASLLGTQKGSINGQGAINVPLIDDVLAVRVAGAIDQGDGNFVHSVSGGVSPFRNTESGRASVSLNPFEGFDAGVVYQYTHQNSRQYVQYEGQGASGGVLPTAPFGYNGPRIEAGDRATASEAPRFADQTTHQITGFANLSVLGHTLSYVGGYVEQGSHVRQAQDNANLVRGDYFQDLHTTSVAQSHELRLASDNRSGFLSYTAGYFHSYSRNSVIGVQPASFLPGAFGSPADVPDPGQFNPRFALDLNIASGGPSIEDSFFGNVTLRLGRRTELTGGVRYIRSKQDASTSVKLASGLIAQAIGLPCDLAGFPSTYPGYCDIPITLNQPVGGGVNNKVDKPVVYNVSLSHRFSDSILVYATIGSSWRRGGNNFFTNNAEHSPALDALLFLANETSTSYEVGLKTNFLDRRLRFNIAGFYQRFRNLNFQLQAVPYLSANGATVVAESSTFSTAADAEVKGFDADLSFAVTPNWSFGVTASYADGKVANDLIPCRDSNFDGVPDAGVVTVADFRARNLYIAQCVSNQSVSRDPLWSATAQSELRQPLGASEGYLRGLLSFYPENDRRNVGYRSPAYALVNLYAGVRAPEGQWDVGVFARNLFDTGVRLGREPVDVNPLGNTSALFGDGVNTGYREVVYTPPLEVGVSVRYAFGSR